MKDSHQKLFAIIWCSIFLPESVISQGYYYYPRNVNSYKIINGRVQHKPSTTPEPSLLETIFPWMGDSYESSKTPAEDAAILNSISDLESSSSNVAPVVASESDGSWFSLPGFGSSDSTDEKFQHSVPPQHVPHPMDFPTHGAPNNMHFYNGPPLSVAPSQAQPVMVLPPENFSPPYGSAPGQPFQQHGLPPHNSPHSPHPHNNYVHHEIRQNMDPAFQFHQQIKESIPIPALGQTGVFGEPFPHQLASAVIPNLPVSEPAEATTEKSTSFLDMLSSYFSFGKRSDEETDAVNHPKAIVARSLGESSPETESSEGASSDEEEVEEEKKSSSEGDDDDASAEKKSEKEKDFPCPKSGVWQWNGEVCIAVGPNPVWACRPNDLIVSGKIAICRNKIYFSPKVLPRNTDEDEE